MKKILFPTDFSATANNAFLYALRLADKLNASITTVHVYNRNDVYLIERGNIQTESLNRIYETIDMDRFENFKDSVPALRSMAEQENLGHIEIYHVMEERPVIPKIVQMAKTGDYDMIVMGTKGAGWIKEVFFGTVTGEVMERATCPVLAVPDGARFDKKFDKIAMATEFKSEEKHLLKKVLELSEVFNAEVYCLNVDVAGIQFYEEQKKAFKEAFKSVPRVHFKTIADIDIIAGLNEYLEKHKMDMICMVVHKRNFLQEFFKYSMAKALSYQSKTPILTYHAHILKPESENL